MKNNCNFALLFQRYVGKSLYKIQFGGLPVGIHDYEFEIKDAFFKNIENSEVTKANIIIEAKLTKQNNLLQLDFEINGTVQVECDRCLKDFDIPINSSEHLVIKHGNPSESTDDILVIPEGMDEFSLEHYLYEYIVLALPVRKVPCEMNKKLFQCDEETLSKLSKLIVSEDKEEEKNENNPLWEQLNKIKYNKN